MRENPSTASYPMLSARPAVQQVQHRAPGSAYGFGTEDSPASVRFGSKLCLQEVKVIMRQQK